MKLVKTNSPFGRTLQPFNISYIAPIIHQRVGTFVEIWTKIGGNDTVICSIDYLAALGDDKVSYYFNLVIPVHSVDG